MSVLFLMLGKLNDFGKMGVYRDGAFIRDMERFITFQPWINTRWSSFVFFYEIWPLALLSKALQTQSKTHPPLVLDAWVFFFYVAWWGQTGIRDLASSWRCLLVFFFFLWRGHLTGIKGYLFPSRGFRNFRLNFLLLVPITCFKAF